MLSVRRARYKDRIGMKACNERNLKENYPQSFWNKHLLSVPFESRVATVDENVIVGYLLSDGFCVLSLAVDEKYRRQGLARAMLEDFLAHTKSDKQHLHVRASNQHALKLYTDLGFQTVKVLPQYYRDPVEDGLEMHRTQPQ